MKSFLTVIALLFVSSLVLKGQSTVEGVLRKYKNDGDVVSIMYEGDQLKKFLKQKQDIKSSVEHIDVLVFKNNASLSAKDKAKLGAILQKEAYETLVDVKNKDAKARVMGIGDVDKLTHVFIEVNSEGYLIFATLKGNVLIEEISKIVSSVDLDELDNFKILK